MSFKAYIFLGLYFLFCELYKLQLPIHSKEERFKASSGFHCRICIQELHHFFKAKIHLLSDDQLWALAHPNEVLGFTLYEVPLL